MRKPLKLSDADLNQVSGATTTTPLVVVMSDAQQYSIWLNDMEIPLD